MAGVPGDELIDFRSPEKKSFNMLPRFAPLLPIPLVNISSCSSPLDFVNYGSNPFDQLVEQSNINFDAKNDPFEMVCKTAFQCDTREKCVFSPDKFRMGEYKDNNLLNTSVNISRCVKEQFSDICTSAMYLRKQVPGDFEICDNSNVDLLSSTHRIDLESENVHNNCDVEKLKETLHLDKCNNSTDSVKLLDLPSPKFENTKNSGKINMTDICNKLHASYVAETKSNFEIKNECIYTKKSLNRSFSSAEDQIFRPNNCVDSEKAVKDIVAERVEKCIQKALDNSRCYRTNSITNLSSSYSAPKVKPHRRSYSSSSVRDAEFISWLGLDKSKIKHRKSDFNIDVELCKFNNQCISDIRNLNLKKSFSTSDRMDLYIRRSSNLQHSMVILSDISPIPGNGMPKICSHKTEESNGTDNFSQVTDISDEVFFEANLISSAITRSTSVAGGCVLLEDEDILTTRAPWELQSTESNSSEDCDDVGTKDFEEIQSKKTTFVHSTPITRVKGIFSSKNEEKIFLPHATFTPVPRMVQKEPRHLFPYSEDTKKGPLKAVIPVGKMTKLPNTKGTLPANTKADKSSENQDMKPKKPPSPKNISESVRVKLMERSSLGTDSRQSSSLRRIVSHGSIISPSDLKKSIQASFHERSRSVDVKVDNTKLSQNDLRLSRRIQSASNLQTAKKEMKKSPIFKPLIRSTKIAPVQKTISKISPHLQKVSQRLSNGTVSRSGKGNITP